MSREVMQQALDALEREINTRTCKVSTLRAMNALREALAQPEQEPVMWVMPDGKTVDKWALQFYGGQVGKPLYATPFQRKPLTEMGVIDLKPIGHHSLQLIFDSQASIEAFKAAHGIKEQP